MLMLLVYVSALITECAICQTCWGQSCYYFAGSSVELKFSDGYQVCSMLGGRLLEIETVEEDTFVLQFIEGMDPGVIDLKLLVSPGQIIPTSILQHGP